MGCSLWSFFCCSGFRCFGAGIFLGIFSLIITIIRHLNAEQLTFLSPNSAQMLSNRSGGALFFADFSIRRSAIPVPEPTSAFCLLGLGALGVGLRFIQQKTAR